MNLAHSHLTSSYPQSGIIVRFGCKVEKVDPRNKMNEIDRMQALIKYLIIQKFTFDGIDGKIRLIGSINRNRT